MGRPPWATPEQLEFLESRTEKLEQQKSGNGLKAYYNLIAHQFLEKWPVTPNDEDQKKAVGGLELQTVANARRTKVNSPRFSSIPCFDLIHC